MAVTTFIPEVWAAKILSAFKQELVYGALCNRDYEGDIAQSGDTVHITSLADPTIAPYVKGVTEIDPAQLNTTDDTLVIDQSHYFAFEVDDIDKRQLKGDVMPEAMDRAAFGMADLVDQYIAGFYTDADAGNVIAATAITDGDKAYTGLVSLRTVLNKAKVPKKGRWVVVPSWYTALLLENSKFVANPALGQAGANLQNGAVGRIAGFDVYESENVPTISGDDDAVMAGHPSAITLAEQINKVEAYRPESSFSDAVKGLLLYGAKVIRPTALAVLTASQTAVGG